MSINCSYLLFTTEGNTVDKVKLQVDICQIAKALPDSHSKVYDELLKLNAKIDNERKKEKEQKKEEKKKEDKEKSDEIKKQKKKEQKKPYSDRGFLLQCSGSVNRVALAQGVSKMFNDRMSLAQQRLHFFYETMRNIAERRGSPKELIKQHLIRH